jgi:LysR family glycine cleavage system transcriptional activator
MNYKQTPPIQWLPVFEAAASRLSFKQAAESLCVSPPAVSQQIRAFENWLGVELFDRRARKLALTEEGDYYLGVARKVLQAHTQGYVEFKRRLNKQSFNVSTSLFIAQEILLPNYLSFSDCCPGTELRIEARMSLSDFDNEPVDAAIRLGTGDWAGVSSKKLCDVYIAPVASPGYLLENPVKDITDLKHHRLLYSSSNLEDWTELGLLESSGDPNKNSALVFDSYMTALKAASEGVGIALGLFPITNSWVNRGLLCCPLTKKIKSSYSHWSCAPKNYTHPATGAFHSWCKTLFDEIPPIEVSNQIAAVGS